MLFSILIANFNNGHFFNDCYRSIITQTYTNWEAIIVDDGSSDDSVEVIKNMIRGDDRFKLFASSNNKGCGYIKLTCATLAKGDILGFLDPDDALTPEALELMVKEHKKEKDAALISSNYELVDLEMNTIRSGSHAGEVPAGKSFLTYGKGALTAFATFKKKYYERTGGLDSSMKRAVDQDLYYKLEEQGKVIFLNRVLYRYRIHENSISQNENLYKALYWHYYAKKKAYIRRKKNNSSLDNFTTGAFRELSSDYYLGRFEKVKFTSKKRSKYYFIWKAVISNPFHKFERKIKSLVLLLMGRL